MKASILTIGDELLIGQVINTNAAWIAAQLTQIGVEVVRHVTCADDDVDIMRCLNEESQGVQLLILTGGLGPTSDDLTADAVALPSACTVLVNRNGTAPGMLFDDKNLLLVSLPGVPSEMKDIMTTSVLPIIRQRVESEGTLIRYYRTIHTVGIAEAYLADMLSPLEEVLGGTATLAFLPNVAGVRLRIGVPSLAEDRANEALDTIEGKIRERLPDHAVFGTGDTTLAEEVVRLLQVRGSTIAVAESCTAGLLGAAITDVPGASQVFPGGVISYANSIKHQFLDVDESILQTAGAVSSECAVAMAEGVRRAFATTYGVAITGVAGPDGGSPEKPVGTVWIAVATHGTTRSAQYRFGTDRSANRQRSVMMALAMIWQELRGQHA
ncbi:MAG: nicotinamide-nucleotide amidohydrolase family protein [Candidatus Kapabacteria bacterium]|nr:nicotinamide-nucleotide amidohydrolase family protein [Candidatus Kapabacteria bacterium]